jgi:hypothetical protein
MPVRALSPQPRKPPPLTRYAPALALLVLACAVPMQGAFAQQDGQIMRAPLPLQRPYDLDLPAQSTLPPVVVAPRAASIATSPTSPAVSEPEEDEGPEWPKLAPGQKAGAEPQFDPDEKPDRPGISTDPGTSILCLPQALKDILVKVAGKYGAVKVTSTWRPPWRARRGSYHKRCEAMDFRVPGIRPRAVLDFARSLPEVGGNKVYWNGLIHIDTGPRRPW